MARTRSSRATSAAARTDSSLDLDVVGLEARRYGRELLLDEPVGLVNRFAGFRERVEPLHRVEVRLFDLEPFVCSEELRAGRIERGVTARVCQTGSLEVPRLGVGGERVVVEWAQRIGIGEHDGRICAVRRKPLKADDRVLPVLDLDDRSCLPAPALLLLQLPSELLGVDGPSDRDEALGVEPPRPGYRRGDERPLGVAGEHDGVARLDPGVLHRRQCR
ncbi:hypothetical protein ACFPRL_16845 [Pseudoclavibacter helvolus]